MFASIAKLGRRLRANLHSTHAAIDLASIMVGVIVISIIAAGAVATVAAVIPWSQDRAAQENLDAVATAEAATFVLDGNFVAYDSHPDSEYHAFESSRVGLTRPAERLIIQTSECSQAWVAAQRSASGKVFMRMGGNGYSCNGDAPEPPETPTTAVEGPGFYVIDDPASIDDPTDLPPTVTTSLPPAVPPTDIPPMVNPDPSTPYDFGAKHKPGYGLSAASTTAGATSGGGNVGMLSASDDGLYYLKASGQLYALNDWTGIGGRGPETYTTVLTPILSNTRFSTIDSGAYSALAIDSNKHLWTWGLGDDHTLGHPTADEYDSDGNAVDQYYDPYDAEMILPSQTFKAVAGGVDHSMALDTDGHLWTWGMDTAGELGGGDFAVTGATYRTELYRDVPEMVTPGVQYTAISAGYGWGLALDTTGHMWEFGDNGYARGNSTEWEDPWVYCPGPTADWWCSDVYGVSTTPPGPVMLTPERTYKKIEAGAYHGLAIDSTNHLYTWGSNGSGESGDGTGEDLYEPTLVAAGQTFKDISGDTWADHSLAVDTAGHLWAFGGNDEGELGDNTTDYRYVPTLITPDVTYAQAEAGSWGQSYGLGRDGTLYAWGESAFGDQVVANPWVPNGVDWPEDSAPAFVTDSDLGTVVQNGYVYVSFETSGYPVKPGTFESVGDPLPNGLTLNYSGVGYLTGRAAVDPGVYNITIRASAHDGQYIEKVFTLTVVAP